MIRVFENGILRSISDPKVITMEYREYFTKRIFTVNNVHLIWSGLLDNYNILHCEGWHSPICFRLNNNR